jgi:predicted ATPase
LDVPAIEPLNRLVGLLEGIPLAIELAAGRLRWITPDAMMRQLQETSTGLSGGRRDTPHHRTLHQALDHSWQGLSEQERATLMQASIFCGGISLAMLEQALAGQVTNANVPAVVYNLCEKSLLRPVHEPDSAPRFDMYFVIRAYAQQHLAAVGATEIAQRHHALAFAELAASLWRDGDKSRGSAEDRPRQK